jgi:hypothetical protein
MATDREDAANLRNWFTPGNIGVAVGVVATLAGAVTWVDHHFISADEAQAMETRIMGEARARESRVMRRLEWAAVTDARRDAIVARNRVNECNIKREKKDETMSQLERSVCAQYDDDLHLAQGEYEKALSAAKAMSKE